LVGQAVLLLAVEHGMGLSLPLVPLLLLVGTGLILQLGLWSWLRAGRGLSTPGLLAILSFDSLLLTALLALSGGPFNPFSIFLLVNLALGAVLLPPRSSWTLVVISLALFGALFFVPEGTLAGLRLPDHAALMTLHLQGMWVASAAAGIFIVHFVQRITRALAARDAALSEARQAQARTDRIRGLATLSAGTAHELSTPLSTIAVASAELERQLLHVGAASEALEDVALIRSQVRRCREVLQQLSVEAGHPLGEAVIELRVDALLASALEGLPGAARIALPPAETIAGLTLLAPARALGRTLRSLLKNALQASNPSDRVWVEATVREGALMLVVADRGRGMPPEILARAGEPFFSTREPGEGMGLGLYLARGLTEQLGGSLHLASTPGRGTRVTLTLPLAADTRAEAG
jgi:two-component system sensor histidine kinase RegB